MEKTYEVRGGDRLSAPRPALSTCTRELYVHLREKVFPGLRDIAVQADYFAEARGGTKYVVQRDSREGRSRSSAKPRDRVSRSYHSSSRAEIWSETVPFVSQ